MAYYKRYAATTAHPLKINLCDPQLQNLQFKRAQCTNETSIHVAPRLCKTEPFNVSSTPVPFSMSEEGTSTRGDAPKGDSPGGGIICQSEEQRTH